MRRALRWILCLAPLALWACADVDEGMMTPTPIPDARTPNGDMSTRDAGQCIPNCAGRACGADGCGGVCGVCDEGSFCEADQCTARPASCGDDACGAGEDCWNCPLDCGACCGDGACVADHQEDCSTCPMDCGCPDGEVCNAEGGLCEVPCTADCAGRDCGDDGCGGRCGECADRMACTVDGRCLADPQCGDGFCDAPESCADCPTDCACPDGEACDAQGRCVGCVPACAGAVCGDDGCGGSCGACGAAEDCADGRCVARCAPDCAGRACGDDGCGGRCGECEADEGCTPAGQCLADCQPSCDGRACGDDGCGGSCGGCDAGFACAAGVCVLDCPGDCGPVGGAACDAQGQRACVDDPERPGCTTWARRVPCAAGRACADDLCAGACTTPQLVVALDRSASMAERWPAVQASLARLLRERGAAVQLGVRLFPAAGGDGCGVAAAQPPGALDAATLADLPPPAAAEGAPLTAALAGLEQAYGAAAEAQAVLLITDGADGCGPADGAVAAAAALRVRQLRVFTVALPGADAGLLERVAQAGGGAAFAAEGAEGLSAALDATLSALDACACQAGARACDGDTLRACGADGRRWDALEACVHGCDPATTACFPVCRPGVDQRCDGDALAACGPAGDAYVAAAGCEFGCQAGQCNRLCRPDTSSCVDGALQRCAATGDQRQRVTECLLDCDGAMGACRREARCEPGEVRCGVNGRLTCRPDGRGFQVSDRCPGACTPAGASCAELRDGALRLAGDAVGQGRVELFFGGQWGTVCAEGFDAAAAQVVCRQAGYPSVIGFEVVGGGAGPVWVDDLACGGDEARLADCGRGPLGMGDCDHAQDVAVTCVASPEPPPDQVCLNGQEITWAADGAETPTPCPEGRCAADGLACDDEPVRMCAEPNTRWCEDGVTATCGVDTIERRLECPGGCGAAGGVCSSPLLRLGDGGLEGPLTVRVDGGVWQPVCADGFGPAEHTVACRTLGLAPIGRASAEPGAATTGATCQGGEAAWTDCAPAGGCDAVARIACRPPRPGLSLCEGGAAVELHDDGLWRLRQCEGACDAVTGRCEGEIPPLVNFCRLQFPWAAEVGAGGDVTAYGRLYQAGLTDQSPRNDPTPRVIAEVGYGPDGTQPTEAGWVWFPGAPNPGYEGAEPNNDEYWATVPAPAPGAYDLAWRFSMDGGRTFVFCDGQPAGSSDGYQPEWAGDLRVE